MTINPYVNINKVIDTSNGQRKPLEFLHTKKVLNIEVLASSFQADGDFWSTIISNSNFNLNHLPIVIIDENLSEPLVSFENFKTCFIINDNGVAKLKLVAELQPVGVSKIKIPTILLFETGNTAPIRGMLNSSGGGKWSYNEDDLPVLVEYLNGLGNVTGQITQIQDFLDGLSTSIQTGQLNANLISANSIESGKLIVDSKNLISRFDSFEQYINKGILGTSYNISSSSVVDNVDAYNGLASLRIQTNGSNAYKYINPFRNDSSGWVTIQQDNTYTFSFRAKAPSLPVSGSIELIGSKNSLVVPFTVATASTWNAVAFSSSTVFETNEVLAIKINIIQSGVIVYFDGLQLEIGNTATAFTPTGRILIEGGNLAVNAITAQNGVIESLDATKITTGSLNVNYDVTITGADNSLKVEDDSIKIFKDKDLKVELGKIKYSWSDMTAIGSSIGSTIWIVFEDHDAFNKYINGDTIEFFNEFDTILDYTTYNKYILLNKDNVNYRFNIALIDTPTIPIISQTVFEQDTLIRFYEADNYGLTVLSDTGDLIIDKEGFHQAGFNTSVKGYLQDILDLTNNFTLNKLLPYNIIIKNESYGIITDRLGRLTSNLNLSSQFSVYNKDMIQIPATVSFVGWYNFDGTLIGINLPSITQPTAITEGSITFSFTASENNPITFNNLDNGYIKLIFLITENFNGIDITKEYTKYIIWTKIKTDYNWVKQWDQNLTVVAGTTYVTPSLFVGAKNLNDQLNGLVLGKNILTNYNTIIFNQTTNLYNSSTKIFTVSNHGFIDNEGVRFLANYGTLPTGIISGQEYFIKNATANTFQISSTIYGLALTTSSNGLNFVMNKTSRATIMEMQNNGLATMKFNIDGSAEFGTIPNRKVIINSDGTVVLPQITNTDLNNSLNDVITGVQTNFAFEPGQFSITRSDSNLSTTLTTEALLFKDQGTTVASISGKSLNIADAAIGTSLIIGKIKIKGSSDGSRVDFLWIG